MTASAPQKRFVPDTPPEQDLQHVKKHVKALVDWIQEQVPFEEVEATTDRVYLKITLSKRKVPCASFKCTLVPYTSQNPAVTAREQERKAVCVLTL